MLYDLGNFQTSLSIVDALTADEMGGLSELWKVRRYYHHDKKSKANITERRYPMRN